MLCLMVFLPHFYLLTLYAFRDRQDNLRRNSTSSLTPHFRKVHSYRWIGTPVSRCTRQINSRKKQKGLQQIRDHVRKTLDEQIQIYCVFLCDPFLASYFSKHAKTGTQQKYTRQNRIFLIEPSSTEVSGPSEVPWLVPGILF